MEIEYKLNDMACAGDYTPTSEDVLDLASNLAAHTSDVSTFNGIELRGNVEDFYSNIVGQYSIKLG